MGIGDANSLSARIRSGAAALPMPVSESKEGYDVRCLRSGLARPGLSYCSHYRRSARALISPPVALTLHIFTHMLAKTGRTEDEDLEAVRPGLIASPRAR